MKLKLLARSLPGKLLMVGCFVLFISSSKHYKRPLEKPTARVLVFSKTNGFRHKSIPNGIAAIQKLGDLNRFSVFATEDSSYFTAANLKKYNAVIFLSTTGTILGTEGKQAFMNYIHQGGGFVGIHAATDCEYDWPWYVKMVGANFASHPKQQDADLQVVNKTHLSTKHLPDVWRRWDEWYNFKNQNPDVVPLIKIDEKSYQGGKNGDNHPIAWYHKFEGGRIFYTGLGHTEESFEEVLFLKHLLGGIQYSMKRKK